MASYGVRIIVGGCMGMALTEPFRMDIAMVGHSMNGWL